MGVNYNFIISNGLKTNKWWGEEKISFEWGFTATVIIEMDGNKQMVKNEKTFFGFFFSHPILYTSILKNNASKREDDESMVDSLPVSWRLYIFKGFFLLWIIRWLPTSKMPALWQIGETGETWMYCKGDYQLGDGIAHEDQALMHSWPILSWDGSDQWSTVVHTIFLETLSKNKSCIRCLLSVWVPILAAEGPHWVPISLVTTNFGHSACRKLRQDTVG